MGHFPQDRENLKNATFCSFSPSWGKLPIYVQKQIPSDCAKLENNNYTLSQYQIYPPKNQVLSSNITRCHFTEKRQLVLASKHWNRRSDLLRTIGWR